MDEPRGFKRLPVVQAIQGNFDHLMAGIRAIVKSHNLMVGDLEGLQDQAETTDIQVAGHTHDGTDTTPVSHDDLTGVSIDDHHSRDHETRHEKGGADALPIEDLGTATTDTSKRLAPDGAGGVTWGTGGSSSTGSAVPGFPGEDGADGFFMPPASGAAASGALTDHAHTAPGDGGADLFPSGMTEIDGTLAMSTWTSASLAGSVNNYHATSMETGIGVELTLSADWNITGLDFSGSGGPFVNGQVFALRLESGDAHTLTLKHESASSVAANRFFLPGAADLSFSAGTVVFLVYHGGASRWNLWGVEGPPGPTGATGATGATGPAGSAGTGGGGMPAVYDEPDNDLWGMPVPPRDTQKHVINWTSKLRVAAGDTSQRIYPPFSGVIREVYFTLPGSTSTTVRVDVKKNGTSIFGTKPSTSSGFISSFAVPSAPTFTRGDYLTVRMDAVGNAGGRILVYIEVTEA